MMIKTRIFAFLMIAAFLFTLSGCQPSQRSNVTKVQKTFDLDILYADQSIIGTAPKAPIWSKSGEHLLFLWNDQGYKFRDVWRYSVSTGEKTRLTFHADDKLSDKINHSGISEVIWLSDKNFSYVLNGQLYVQNQSGVSHHVAMQGKNVSQLRLSPNDDYMAFVAGGDLFVRSAVANNKVSTQLLMAQKKPESFINNYFWSDDSGQIVFQLTDVHLLPERDVYYYADNQLQNNRVRRAFPGDETAEFHVGIIDLETKEQRLFQRPNAQHYVWNYGLSSDGKKLFINESDPLVKNHTIYVYDTVSDSRTMFYQEYDAKHLRPDWQVAWAPNDDGLIILTDKDGYLHLYHKKTASDAAIALTFGEWEIASFVVDDKNSDIYFISNQSHLSERQIYRIPVTGGSIQRISAPQSGTHTFTLSSNKKRLASIFSSDASPPELHSIDLNNDNAVNQITDSVLPTFKQYKWANISYIEFSSDIDDAKLVGRLSVPDDFDSSKKYPLIVGSVYSDSVQNQYGGRTAHPTWGIDQYLVAQGYLVLNVNIRGSWGQGRQHNQGLRYGYGVIDIEDLHSGVKYLIKKGFVDPDRVGIWGSSYGGLMTMMSLFKKPGVYAAGIAGAPATNVAHAYPGQMWVMGEPTGDDQPQRYQQQSPLYHTEGLVDPLMIIHGSKDSVVLYSDTIAVVEKLIQQQKMFELVTLPGTGHGWDNEGNAERLFAFKKMVDFFNRYLKQ